MTGLISSNNTSSIKPTWTQNTPNASFLGDLSLGFAAFLGAFVLFEPAPYELFVCSLMVIFFLSGLKITAFAVPLLLLTTLYSLGGVLGMFQLTNPSASYIYVAVTFFLGLTSWFFALVIQQDAYRLKAIVNGYVLGAVLTSAIGILAYFNLLPENEQFLRFGRARGTFQDPNVFAPFLVLPATWLWHGILTRPVYQSVFKIIGLAILILAILLSFSRAGWGLLAFSLAGAYLIVFVQIRHSRQRLQLILIAILGSLLAGGAFMTVLQFDQISNQFVERARIIQDYDIGELGRFQRHILGFQLALEKPFGIGRAEFARRFTEDPHNIWLKSLMVYGWLGFAAFLALTLATIKYGFENLFLDRPWLPFLQVTYIVFIGHIIMAYVIDIDHWRHMFLILGILWGMYGLEADFKKNKSYQNGHK